MKFLVTDPFGQHDVLNSEAEHADAAAMMHWGLPTAQEVWDRFKVKIETVVNTVEHGWHSVDSSSVEKVNTEQGDEDLAATIQTKTYADGSTATGVPPLPAQSSAEQGADFSADAIAQTAQGDTTDSAA